MSMPSEVKATTFSTLISNSDIKPSPPIDMMK
jgi:hypothetical protein